MSKTVSIYPLEMQSQKRMMQTITSSRRIIKKKKKVKKWLQHIYLQDPQKTVYPIITLEILRNSFISINNKMV